jgi:polysaccharide biosynthesis/export protein
MLAFTRRICALPGSLVCLGFLVAVGWGCSSVPSAEKVKAASSPGEVSSGLIQDRAEVPTSDLLGLPAAPDGGAKEEPAASEKPETEAYTLGPGDILDFRCFDDETLSKEVVVRYDGCVSLNLVPDVRVEGITREEAEELLRQAYAAVFKDPQLSLTVNDSASRVYYVFGDVQSPNEYPFRRQTSVLQAINKAGGMRVQNQGNNSGSEYGTGLGTLTKAFIIRHEGGTRQVLECDLSGITNAGPHPSDVAIMPDDVVYVPEGVNLVYVLGEVQRPSVFQLTENMTLLRLLAQAGGHVETSARLAHVVLMRQVDGGMSEVSVLNVREFLKTGEDIRLQPGDILYIPRKPLLRVQEL